MSFLAAVCLPFLAHRPASGLSLMRVALRVDASIWIGSGHVMRCATLANALRAQGAEIHFICRAVPGDLREWLSAQGVRVHTLPPAVGASKSVNAPHHLGVSLDEEIMQSRDVLAQLELVDWLVVDHYGLDYRWEQAMRGQCKAILAIDDLADRNHDCDLLLDQNLVPGWPIRYATRVLPGCRQMLGPRFALLQPTYAHWHSRVNIRGGPVSRLLVFFGGVDAPNMTTRTLRALASMERVGIIVDVVVGINNTHLPEIQGLSAGIPGVTLHVGIHSLAPLMAAADLAIGAGGTTTWERCCLGLPSLVITLAPNQEPIARELHRRGLVRWLGSSVDVSDIDLLDALETTIDKGLGVDTSRHCLELVDGKGVLRVATVLSASPLMELALRNVEAEDEKLLLEWANDPEVRQFGFSPDSIDSVEHHQWFQRRLADPDRFRIYVAEAASGIPVGQVRFELTEGGYWLISYSVDRPFRRLGLGTRILRDAIRHQASHSMAIGFVGRVRKRNQASCRIFAQLGFTITKADHDHIEYHLSAGLTQDRAL
jgi:UDP-2,4-diacetamido-2,4,6-trideoxy-beta-L-altropyranose hydrolase